MEYYITLLNNINTIPSPRRNANHNGTIPSMTPIPSPTTPPNSNPITPNNAPMINGNTHTGRNAVISCMLATAPFVPCIEYINEVITLVIVVAPCVIVVVIRLVCIPTVVTDVAIELYALVKNSSGGKDTSLE